MKVFLGQGFASFIKEAVLAGGSGREEEGDVRSGTTLNDIEKRGRGQAPKAGKENAGTCCADRGNVWMNTQIGQW